MHLVPHKGRAKRHVLKSANAKPLGHPLSMKGKWMLARERAHT